MVDRVTFYLFQNEIIDYFFLEVSLPIFLSLLQIHL